MAEMTAAEAIRIALKFNQFDVAGVITRMTTHLDGAKQKESAYKQSVESKKALIEQQAAEIERLKVENKRLRVCGNCRHFSTGYTGDYCVNDNCYGECETLRQNTCRDWEMV